ncbi:MAG TPA: alkaline phosphatase family protein [Micromonosporaceae bacterium]
MRLSTSPSARVATAAVAAGAAAALITLFTGATGPAMADHESDTAPHIQLDHAYVIMLENHSQHGVVGDPNAPYITQLANTYGNAENYYGVTHPSEPNYVAAISGSNWWTNDDSPANRFDHTNLVDTLEQAHLTWGAYMEAMPADNKLADYWPAGNAALYASKHNPFVLFNDVRGDAGRMSHVKPYSDLAADLNTGHGPNFVFISPDQCNDMHGGVYTAVAGHPETPCPYGSANDDANDAALKQKADAFVKQAVTTIMSSKAWTRHSAIFIVADEGDYTANATNGGWDSPAGCCDSPVLRAGDPAINPNWPGGVYGGGKVPAIIVTGDGPHHHTSQVAYNHYSLLRTLEDAWRLPELGFTSDHAQVPTMDEFLVKD